MHVPPGMTARVDSRPQFDFFVPKHFVMSDSAKETEQYCSHGEGCFGSTFPSKYECKVLLLVDVWLVVCWMLLLLHMSLLLLTPTYPPPPTLHHLPSITDPPPPPSTTAFHHLPGYL